MTYLERLKEHLSEKGHPDQPPKPTKPSFAGFDGYPRGPISQDKAADTLCDWDRYLLSLNFDTAPDEFTLNRWRQLVDDAEWIYEHFASQLVREGWSALDIFGVLPWREDGGVLLDRLQGARNLKLDGEGRAFWSRFGVTFSTCRGVGEHLVRSGLRLVWELSRGA